MTIRTVGGALAVALLLLVAAAPQGVAGSGAGRPALARSTTSAPTSKLDRLALGLVRAGAPGALVVVRAPTTTRRAARGLADVSQRRLLRTTDRYRIASVTKTFVATVVLQLVGERRLRLDDPVEGRLPGLIPNGRAITIRQLLAHTSGLFDYGNDEAWNRARLAEPGRVWSPRELVAIANGHSPLFAPGSSWSYSNTNYLLLGLVVEAVTGRPLANVLASRLFRPLRLTATSFPAGTAIGGRYAHGYVVARPPIPAPAGTLIDVSTLLSPSAWGAGQIVSNADDVTRFLAALLRGRLLRPAQLRAMKTEVLGSGSGLGLRIARTVCGTAYGHEGVFPGYRNVVWASANGQRVAAVMINSDTPRISTGRLDSSARAALC